jgi:L-iditol 2-dehydrogenase
VDLLRRGTRWNIFGITTHEKFELDGGLAHFLEARMDSSFGTTTESMIKAIKLMQRGLVNVGKIITHKMPLDRIHEGIELIESGNRAKVIINP